MEIIKFSVFAQSIALPLFIIAYFFARRWNFYSLVDSVWPYCFSICALVGVYLNRGQSIEFVVLAVVIAIWGLRLGTHILTRLLKHFPHEDRRYVELKENNAKNLKLFFFGFFMFQSLTVGFLIMPLSVAAQANSIAPTKFFWIGLLLWFVGIFGEWASDEQLKKFIHNPANKGQVCRVGFWRYSRHPNYFFEWLMWVSYALMVTGLNGWYWAWLSPLIMYILLTRVTGIPYAEKMSLRSKGDLFREYQRTTSAFFPWFKKV